MSLATIAFDMKQQARRVGVSQRDLPRGLALELVVVGGQCVLTMKRPVTKPGEMEVTICRDAFGVPEGASRQDGDCLVTLRWPSDL